MGLPGVVALSAGRWPLLKKLALSGQDVGNAGAEALAKGAWPALQALDLENLQDMFCQYTPLNRIDAIGAAALADAFAFELAGPSPPDTRRASVGSRWRRSPPGT